MTGAFWIDWEYDRSRASDGVSRYGSYLRRDAGLVKHAVDDADAVVDFAVAAWRVATGPTMSPPLVRHHPRVLAADVVRSQWNGRLIARVRLVSARPPRLALAATTSGATWWDHDLDAWGGHAEPDDDDLARRAYLLPEARLLWQLPDSTPLPSVVVPTERGRFDAAVQCVRALTSAFNGQVDPVIEELERS
nr:hypothetical protein [Micromonospora sp. DSM 115978]